MKEHAGKNVDESGVCSSRYLYSILKRETMNLLQMAHNPKRTSVGKGILRFCALGEVGKRDLIYQKSGKLLFLVKLQPFPVLVLKLEGLVLYYRFPCSFPSLEKPCTNL